MTAVQSPYTPNAVAQMGPSGDTSGVTDLASIQAAMNAAGSGVGGGTVTLARGQYYINGAITAVSNVALVGAGPNATLIQQKSSSAGGIAGTDVNFCRFEKFQLSGPGYTVGAANGIRLQKSANADVGHIRMLELTVNNWAGHCIYGSVMVVCRFDHVLCQTYGGDGFHFDGTVNTACTFESCYADNHLGAQNGVGHSLSNGLYCSFNGCASDFNFWGYNAIGCEAVAYNGCGTEHCGGSGFEMDGGLGNHLNACAVLNNNSQAVNLASGEKNLTITDLNEVSPASPTASIKTAAGTSCVVINPNITTAASYSAGTAYVITPTGAAAH